MTSHCIYMKGEENLTYSSKEHVIPASLGGVKKLKKGIVSDKANELFSQRERIALHETLLSVNRANSGPGKRGSNKIAQMKEPRVELFEMVNFGHNSTISEDMPTVQLGFLFYGKVYIFNQIIFEVLPNGAIEFPKLLLSNKELRSLKGEPFQELLKRFVLKSNKVPGKDYIIVPSELAQKNRYFILGLYNKKWYVSSPYPLDQTYSFICMLQKRPIPCSIKTYDAPSAIYRYSRELPHFLDPCCNFLYAKTAFNVLALFYPDLVLDSQFDSIRRAIVQGTDCSDYFVACQIPEWVKSWVSDNVTIKSHFVIIYGHNCVVEAYVSFYREVLFYSIQLSQDYEGPEFRKYFVCDFNQEAEQREKYGDIQ